MNPNNENKMVSQLKRKEQQIARLQEKMEKLIN